MKRTILFAVSTLALLFYSCQEKSEINSDNFSCDDINFSFIKDYDVLSIEPDRDLVGNDFYFTVLWGDGLRTDSVQGDVIHQYDSLANYDVLIVLRGPECTADIDTTINLVEEESCDLDVEVIVNSDVVDIIATPIDSSLSYNFHIDWGNGKSEVNSIGSARHVYNKNGSYRILISYSVSNGCIDEYIETIQIQ
jgi:hypothetical protein